MQQYNIANCFTKNPGKEPKNLYHQKKRPELWIGSSRPISLMFPGNLLTHLPNHRINVKIKKNWKKEPGYVQVLAASGSMSMQLTRSSPSTPSWSRNSAPRFCDWGLGGPALATNLSSVDCRETPAFCLVLEHEAFETGVVKWEINWSACEVEGLVVWQATSISLTAASQSKP